MLPGTYLLDHIYIYIYICIYEYILRTCAKVQRGLAARPTVFNWRRAIRAAGREAGLTPVAKNGISNATELSQRKYR